MTSRRCALIHPAPAGCLLTVWRPCETGYKETARSGCLFYPVATCCIAAIAAIASRPNLNPNNTKHDIKKKGLSYANTAKFRFLQSSERFCALPKDDEARWRFARRETHMNRQRCVHTVPNCPLWQTQTNAEIAVRSTRQVIRSSAMQVPPPTHARTHPHPCTHPRTQTLLSWLSAACQYSLFTRFSNCSKTFHLCSSKPPHIPSSCLHLLLTFPVQPVDIHLLINNNVTSEWIQEATKPWHKQLDCATCGIQKIE